VSPLELPAEVGLAGKLEFGDYGHIGISAGDEFHGTAALKFAQPLTRCGSELPLEETLKLAQRNAAQGGHICRLELCSFSKPLPFEDPEKPSIHAIVCGSLAIPREAPACVNAIVPEDIPKPFHSPCDVLFFAAIAIPGHVKHQSFSEILEDRY
jgi:hypothetical protein